MLVYRISYPPWFCYRWGQFLGLMYTHYEVVKLDIARKFIT